MKRIQIIEDDEAIRTEQMHYNEEHGITPQQIKKNLKQSA